jgi:hypothetical protein
METAGERVGVNRSFWERTAQKFSTASLQKDLTAQTTSNPTGSKSAQSDLLIDAD